MSKPLSRLGDVCEFINGGAWKQTEYVDIGIPVVQVSNMKNGTIDINGLKFLSTTSYDRYKKHTLEDGDLIIATVGSHSTQASAAGRATVVPKFAAGMLLNQNAVAIRSKTKFLEQGYLGLIGHSESFQFYLGTVGQGAANQVRIALSAIKEYKCDLPPLRTQQQIIKIHSAYDNLIENNRRRIQLLEQAARLLYKEWFVHLRFPGHEHTQIIDGVPEGWEKKTAFEVMDVLSGGTPKTTNPSYWDGDIPFFTPKDATDFAYVNDTEKSITEAGLKNCNSNLYPKSTVFITARGTVGKINLAQRPMAMNQSCYALVAHPPLNQQFLYFALVDGVEQFRSRAVGAVFDAIVRDTFKLIPFVVPDEKLITAFTEHVSPMLAQIDNLSGQVRSLRKARDLLLPKLMNGEVAV